MVQDRSYLQLRIRTYGPVSPASVTRTFGSNTVGSRYPHSPYSRLNLCF